VVKSPAGFAVENPYLTVARKAQSTMRQWAAELKLTPRSRGKDQADAQDANELRAEILSYIGSTTETMIKALRKDLRSEKANHGYTGNLERELREAEEIGIPWESANLSREANSTATCRALASLEHDGLIPRYAPRGRCLKVRLTAAGEKAYRDLR
jgi:Phage terminase, small subunit